MSALAVHGGCNALGPVPWDFSSNGHPMGPCPAAQAALAQADATRYPDSRHHALREQLAAWHGVAAQRIVLAASGSEFIQRLTAVSTHLAPGPVQVPPHAYGDYARAAVANGRTVWHGTHPGATLRWFCEPCSPWGQDAAPPPLAALLQPGASVLDAVYAPLRLSGHSSWGAAARDAVFVLHSPNKALGLTGVRGAYAVAPAGALWQPWLAALCAAEPSWPLGAHAVALLQTWASAPAQDWLAGTLATLREWKAQQVALFSERGVQTAPSVVPFFCVRLDTPAATLRPYGVQWRDCTSFGLPGWARLNTLPPPGQAALKTALAAQRHT
jgi:histidinol-phosphate aminotransferase